MNASDLDDRLALLRLTCVPGLGPGALARVLGACRRRSLSLSEFFALPVEEYRTSFGLRPRAIAALDAEGLESWRAVRRLEREMAARGIEIIADAGLPDGFPLLFARGNTDLREEPGVAFLASRGADEAALATAERVADVLARAGAHVISGQNRPAYRGAGLAARRRGAALTLVLDRGMLAAWGEDWGRELLAPARVWEERFDPDATLVLSPFRLQDDWVAGNARRRDQLIVTWARVLVVTWLRPGGWLERQCREAAARGTPVLLCQAPRQPVPAGAEELPGARVVTPEEAAEAAMAALGPPGAGLGRAERRRRIAYARALGEVAVARLGAPAIARDVLENSPPPVFTYGSAGGRREPPADLLLAEWQLGEDSERQWIEWLGALRPSGMLVALVPAAFLAGAEAAGARERVLAQGELLALVRLPGEWGVCLLRKSDRGRKRAGAPEAGGAASALVIAPATALKTAEARRRYLEEALARVRARLLGEVTLSGSSAPASALPPTPAGSPSPE